jgi:hypothetical protein
MKTKKALREEPIKKKKRPVEDEPIKKKKKRAVEEEPAKKKKRKSEDQTAGDLSKKIRKLDITATGMISRLDDEGRQTILGASADQIQQLLEVGNADSASSLLQKRMLQALIDLIPHVEQHVRTTKGQRGVYQMNTLVTSVREILSDLQATKDRGAIGAHMVEKVIRPAFLDIGMSLAQEEQHLSTAIRDNTDKEQCAIIRAALRDSVQRMALTIQRKYEESKTGAISFLQS